MQFWPILIYLVKKLMADSDDISYLNFWYYGVIGHTDLMAFLYNFILYQNPEICNLVNFSCSQMAHKIPYFLKIFQGLRLQTLLAAAAHLVAPIFSWLACLFYFLHIWREKREQKISLKKRCPGARGPLRVKRVQKGAKNKQKGGSGWSFSERILRINTINTIS